MKTYEIINPSDAYTFQAPDLQVAALTIFLLSTSFGAKCVSHPGDDEDVPIFLFGGADSWWEATFPDISMEKAVEMRARDVADALSSTLYGLVEARDDFQALTGPISDKQALQDMRIKWNDERRTSLNDISKAAYATAEAVRQKFSI